MGGGEAILARARRDFVKGEFRFVAQAVSHLVFAEPDNQAARALLADTFEQLGYAAESATWRNAYLFGAQELRQGMPKTPPLPPMLRETLAALLRHQGYNVVAAECGHTAVEAIEVFTFDAVIVDILMPGMNGLETIKVFRADAPPIHLTNRRTFALFTIIIFLAFLILLFFIITKHL